MNIYELIYAFWMANDSAKFPPSAVALFFYLLNQANRHFWKMPFKCATSQICRDLSVSEQTVLNSRLILRKNGCIKYSKGHSRTAVPSYTLLNVSGDNLGVDLRDSSGDNLSINKYNNTNNTISISKGKEECSLDFDEMERLFLADTRWQGQVRELLPADAPLDELIQRFFRYLQCTGSRIGSVDECRAYLVNWILKQSKDRKNAVRKQPDQRRSAGVAPSSPCDYDGPF